MPRSARVFIDNACYHIITRGNQKQGVFYRKEDYEYYLYLLHRYKTRYGCCIYAYCLMENHVHLILESPHGLKAMSSFMHGVNQSHTVKFNNKYEKVGHLWQNRYKNYVVLKDRYLYSLLLYVELNPVRANIVERPEDYPWNSYKSRLLGEKNIILDQLNF